MWFDLITTIVISIVVVMILHYLYNNLKDQYTTKKHRDIGRFHNEIHQAILQELSQRDKHPPNSFLPNEDAEEMQHSLMEFVQNIV